MTEQTKQMYTPQNNFYLWQNNDWLNDPKNQIPADYSTWGSFTQLRDNSLNQQIKILTKLNNDFDNLTTDEKKLAIIYKKRLQKYTDWENNLGDYQELKKELNFLQQSVNFTDDNYIKFFAEYGAYCCKNGLSFVLDIDKGSDMQNVENILLDISPTHVSLPSRDYYFDEKFQKQREMYTEHLTKVYKLLKKNDVQLSENFVSDVYEFEKLIAYILMSPAQSRLYDQYYTKTNLQNVYKDIKSHKFTEQKLENYQENEKKK
jgi:putative endopeptidase